LMFKPARVQNNIPVFHQNNKIAGNSGDFVVIARLTWAWLS
jgi:hypothetical protein